MKEKIILIIKGIIVGLGKIIPGVSGSMLAITLGIYDKCVNAIGNFTKDFKNNINLLTYTGLGIIISIGMFSNMVIFLLNNFYFITMCLFVGLIMGGLPKICKDSKINVKNFKNLVLIFLSFFIIIIINLTNSSHVIKTETNIIILFFLGFIEAFTMIVPGISGTAILMLFGYYDLIILRFSQIFNIMQIGETIKFFIPFGLSMLLGVYIMSKIINFCMKRYYEKTHCVIIGLILSSIYLLLIDILKFDVNSITIFLGVLLLFMGYLISYKLDSIIK